MLCCVCLLNVFRFALLEHRWNKLLTIDYTHTRSHAHAHALMHARTLIPEIACFCRPIYSVTFDNNCASMNHAVVWLRLGRLGLSAVPTCTSPKQRRLSVSLPRPCGTHVVRSCCCCARPASGIRLQVLSMPSLAAWYRVAPSSTSVLTQRLHSDDGLSTFGRRLSIEQVSPLWRNMNEGHCP